MTIKQLQAVHRQHTEYIDDHASDGNADLVQRYRLVRRATEAMAARLAREDTVIQTMPDVSPTKWHLGHTSWFFEQFLLTDGPAADPQYRPFHDRFAYIFNSYYVTVGDRHCRIKRGTLSRPTLDEVLDYRHHVDRAVERQLHALTPDQREAVEPLLVIGLHHEQQHIELAHTDIKHVFSCNPLYPAYADGQPDDGRPTATRFLHVGAGLHEIGHDGDDFSYDNERPRHQVYLQPFEIADRLVTNGEFLEFVGDGGYERAELWLSEGWAQVCADRTNWSAPFYWHRDGDEWHEFTLGGLVPLDRDAPVCHLSYFEADAFARWSKMRLPTEAEWEVAVARHGDTRGSFLDAGRLHPRRD
ncbi:MAG: ergothioneine biosynthesis protein EgtB, partial [Planctomycetota bacterium]